MITSESPARDSQIQALKLSEDLSPVVCYAVCTGKQSPTFRRDDSAFTFRVKEPSR